MAAEREDGIHDSGRIVAFSDGVVAIAITLLILPLTGIDLPHTPEAVENPLAYIWTTNYALIFSFLISWYVIIVFWLVHHRTFGMIEKVNGTILWLNIVWLFAVVLLPFPANLIGQTGGTQNGGLTAFYIGNIFLISLMLRLMSVEAAKHPNLLAQGVTAYGMSGSSRGWVISGYLAICAVVGFFVPTVVLWMLFGIALMGPLTGAIDKRNDARRANGQDQSTSSSR